MEQAFLSRAWSPSRQRQTTFGHGPFCHDVPTDFDGRFQGLPNANASAERTFGASDDNKKQGQVFLRSIIRRIAARLLANPRIRTFVEQEFQKTHPILNNPQIRFAPPGHFYSPLPDLSDITIGSASSAEYSDGVALNREAQLDLLRTLSPFGATFDWPGHQAADRRYWSNNGYFDGADGVVLFSMIRHLQPRRIIEVGSGFSSALMLDTSERYFDARVNLTFIEPYPDRLNRLLRPSDKSWTQLLEKPVQLVGIDTFTRLNENDILFIDSSHVLKAASDVNFLLFCVLPQLKPGVVVHVHDIFYPFEYPGAWLQEGRAWNELYALRAFLQYNNAFEILMFNSYLASQHRALVQEFMPRLNDQAGSIWLRRR